MKRLAQYADLATYSQAILRHLRVPVVEQSVYGGPCFATGEVPLFDEEAAGELTEHMERDFATSAAVVCGYDKHQRNFLGRWSPDQSDDYLRTAGQVITEMQITIARRFREGNLKLDDESVTLERIAERMRKRGCDEDRVASQMDRLTGALEEYRNRWRDFRENFEYASPFRAVASDDDGFAEPQYDAERVHVAEAAPLWEGDELDLGDLEPENEAEPPTAALIPEIEQLLEQAREEAEEPKYYVKMVRLSAGRHFRRLHKAVGTKCPHRPDVNDPTAEWHFSLATAQYDAVCLRCWPRSEAERPHEGGEATGSESSSEQPSSGEEEATPIEGADGPGGATLGAP